MQLYYCAKCGSRLPNDEAARVQPEEEPANILCVGCAPQVPAADFSHAAAGPKLATHTPAMPARAISAAKTRTTELRTRPSTNTNVSASNISRATRGAPVAPGKSGPNSGQKNNTMIYAGVGVGALAILFGLYLIAGSSAKPEAHVARTDETKPDPSKSTTSPAPKSDKPIETKSTTNTPTTAPEGTQSPKPIADPVFSPKEDYERRVKAGLIKTNEPATPATPATPDAPKATDAPATGPLPGYSADDPSWKLIFNGKDTTGWHDLKGHFTVQDGCLIHVAGTGNAFISTDVNYGDFDLSFKIMLMAGGRHAEVKVRESSSTFYIDGGDFNVWRDVRVSAHGGQVRASVNGEPLASAEGDGAALTGPIQFYCSNVIQYKIKDLAIRTK